MTSTDIDAARLTLALNERKHAPKAAVKQP